MSEMLVSEIKKKLVDPIKPPDAEPSPNAKPKPELKNNLKGFFHL